MQTTKVTETSSLSWLGARGKIFNGEHKVNCQLNCVTTQILYREAINRELKAKVICTSDVVEELEELVLLAKQIGVEVVFWEDS